MFTSKYNKHAAKHQNGGGDEISIAGLSGEPADVVSNSLFNANTIIYATADNTPLALTINEQRVVGRITAGDITALTGAQIMSICTGQVDAAFSFNTQDVSDINDLTVNNIIVGGGVGYYLNIKGVSWDPQYGSHIQLYKNTQETVGFIYVNIDSRVVFDTNIQVDSQDQGNAWIELDTGNAEFNDVEVRGEAKGTKEMIWFNYNGTDEAADLFINLKLGETATIHNATKGAVMTRAGSITGVSINYDITQAGTGSGFLYVYKNNGSVWICALTDITVGNNKKEQWTQARGTDTFVAGDDLKPAFSIGISKTDNWIVGNLICGIEVMYDT